jgi:hypothetical protein
MRRLAKLGEVAVHALIAMLITVTIGITVAARVGHLLATPSQCRWVDIPYSPLIWGTAFVCAYFLNQRLESRAATWVWIVGIAWFLVVLSDQLRFHRPELCGGCSLFQDTWNTYFAWDYRKCADSECLGQVFATTPLLNSLAYSIGAWVGLRSRKRDS